MSDEKFSLCIPYYNFLENKVDRLMWRIADFSSNKKEFYKATYTEIGDEDYLPRKLSVNPNKSIPFKPSIYKWTRSEDFKVWSNDTEIVPIEIIKLENFISAKHNSDSEIRNLLHTGILLPEHTLDKFLLIVNEGFNSYDALVFSRSKTSAVDKNIFKIEKTCQDISKAIHKVELIEIDKTDIIDTCDCKIYSENNIYAPIRYFYKYLELPRSTRLFELRDPQDYAKAFISKYLKNKQEIISATNKDRQRLAQIIDVALKDEEEMKLFFKETGYDINNIKYIFSDLNSEILDFINSNTKLDIIIEDIFLKNESLRSEFIDIAEKLWIEEATEIQAVKESEFKEVELKLEEAINSKNEIFRDIEKEKIILEELKEQILKTEKEISDLELNKLKIQTDIQKQLEKFQTDVVHLASMTALSNNNLSNNSNKGFISKKSIGLEKSEIEPAEDLDDFRDDLQTNLSILGIEDVVAVAKIVTSTIIAKKNLIININSDDFSDAISVILDNQYSEKIFITDSEINIDGLIEHINQSNNRVILIYGLLDIYNEKLFTTLSYMCENKLIIFACEDVDTFETLPPHWWKYATILPLESINKCTYEKYYAYNVDENLFKLDKNINVSSEIDKKIKGYFKEEVLSQIEAVALRDLFAISEEKLDGFTSIENYLLKNKNE